MSVNANRGITAFHLKLVSMGLEESVGGALRTFRVSEKLVKLLRPHLEENFFDFVETAATADDHDLIDHLLSERVTPFNPFVVVVHAMPKSGE